MRQRAWKYVEDKRRMKGDNWKQEDLEEMCGWGTDNDSDSEYRWKRSLATNR